MSKIRKDLWKNPEYRKKMEVFQQSEEWKEFLKRKAKKEWKDLEFQRKQKEARCLKPSGLEIKVASLLKELGLINWEYTGDFSFWIGNRNPDFINKEQKKIIEVNGAPGYYHFQDETEKKVKFFKKHGYDTLVIWESELSKESKLRQKIKRFNR